MSRDRSTRRPESSVSAQKHNSSRLSSSGYGTGFPEMRIGDLRVRVPIVQGGMGVGISLSSLASAVAAAGAIGVIAAVGIGMSETDFDGNFREANQRALRHEIRRSRELADGRIGVNLMLALTDSKGLARVALEEGVDVLFLGAGLPCTDRASLPMDLDRLRAVATKVVPKVSSPRAARLIFRYWERNYGIVPDAVVIEGPQAGGHLGFHPDRINDSSSRLDRLVPRVVAAVEPYEQQYGRRIPVIAAGGIFTGEDIRHALELGAAGVKMGTRFVATHECDAAPEFKQAYLDCRREDIVIIQSPVGMPARAIRNDFLDRVAAGKAKPFKCPWKCLRMCDFRSAPYCIGRALYNAKTGDMANGFVMVGANAWRIDRILSVRKLIALLEREYDDVSTSVVARPGNNWG